MLTYEEKLSVLNQEGEDDEVSEDLGEGEEEEEEDDDDLDDDIESGDE